MSNSVVTLSSFNILFFTQVLTVLTSTIKYNEYVTDKGENISIPCIADGNIMWVKENGSNNSTIIQTGKYLVLTNVSASDKGLYVCFAAVTSSQSLEYDDNDDDDDQNETNNSTSFTKKHEQQIDKDEVEQNDNDDEKDEQVLLTSTTTKINNHDNDTTFVKPLVENKNIIKHNTKTTTTTTVTQNASTTSMLPMPNVTRTTTTTRTPTLSVSASASASSATATTTTIVIKTLTNANFSTNITRNPDHNNNTNSSSYHSISSSSSNSSNSSSDLNLTTLTPITPSGSSTIDDIEEQEFQAFQKINLTVRTPPGPVTKLYFKASTILGFLIWRFNKTNSGGYPVRSFTAEFRNVSYVSPPFNSSFEHKWSRMDPINIAPNVRQMEVYRLEPNTTYEFRIWANNQLGSGEVVTTNVTTLPETKEEDLIRLIQPDLDNFDPRIWIVAVSIVLGTFVILAIGLCIVLTKECYQSSQAGTETNSICINNQNNSKISYFNNTRRHGSSDVSNNIIVVVDDDDGDDHDQENFDHHSHNQENHHQQQHHHIIVDAVNA